MPNIFRFQLLQFEDLTAFIKFHYYLNTFGFWNMGQTQQAICRCRVELWENCDGAFKQLFDTV